jgi:aspartate racemase
MSFQGAKHGAKMRAGIVGGLGPETSCEFCLNINHRLRRLSRCQPDLVIENIAVPLEVEESMIKGRTSSELLALLQKAVVRLNRSEADFIAIPCNTVHVFIDQLRQVSKKPILSIIEECANECKKRGVSNVGILATTKTVKSRLYTDILESAGIRVITPSGCEQKEISRIILRIIDGKAEEKDKGFMLRIISDFSAKGAEAVILGCTDLQIMIKESCLPIIDSCAVLEDCVVRMLSSKDKKIMQNQEVL